MIIIQEKTLALSLSLQLFYPQQHLRIWFPFVLILEVKTFFNFLLH